MEENNARTSQKVSEVLWSQLGRSYQKRRIQHFILSVPRIILAEYVNVSNIFVSVTVLWMIVLLVCTLKNVLLQCLLIQFLLYRSVAHVILTQYVKYLSVCTTIVSLIYSP